MIDNQEEKIKKILKKNGIQIKDVLDKIFPQGKGSYYNAVRKNPLDKEFLDKMKSIFSIDLVKELEEFNNESKAVTSPEMAMFLEIMNENRKLNAEIKELLKNEIQNVREVNALKEKLRESEAKQREMEDKIKKIG